MLNNEVKKNREIREKFLNMKSSSEIEAIEPIRNKFLNDRNGITKNEYNELIKYYIGTDLNNWLSYDNYKYGEYRHMSEKEQGIYSIVLKRCIML